MIETLLKLYRELIESGDTESAEKIHDAIVEIAGNKQVVYIPTTYPRPRPTPQNIPWERNPWEPKFWYNTDLEVRR